MFQVKRAVGERETRDKKEAEAVQGEDGAQCTSKSDSGW